MKRKKSKLLWKIVATILCCVWGMQLSGERSVKALAASGDYVAEVDFGNRVAEGKNLSLVVSTNPDAITEEVTKAGVVCRHTPSGNYAYFKVNDSAVPQSQKDLFFEITYFDEGMDNLVLQYNSTDNNYSPIYFERKNTSSWVTTTFCVENAALKNAQNGNADFRIGGDSYIKSVKIYFGRIDLNSTDWGKRTGGSSYSELTGKSVAGYQAWFTTGGANDRWTHWGSDDKWPRLNHHTVDYYPDVKEYAPGSLAQTGFANLGSGEPAQLFASQTQDVMDTHFSWMREYGIDGAALQRFSTVIESRFITGNPENHLYSKVKKAAEKNQRIFYLMYDISGAKKDRYVEDIKFDWIYNVEQGCELLNSKSYATVNGKPVVCIWGMGVPDRITERYEELVDFFKNRNCYLILGTNQDWRSQTEYSNIFLKADGISPWYVGRFADYAGIDSFYGNVTQQDINYCNSHHLDYYPVVWSGFSWATWNNGAPNSIPRNAGQFLWHQVYKLKSMGIKSCYFAMFDEYDEGTAIMKNASDYFDIPTDQYFVTASADGYWLSSDYQLRVAGAAIEMVKGKTPLTDTCNVAHSEGPIYYRNSFEKRYLSAKESRYSGEYPVDPCFKNPGQISVNAVSQAKTEIVKTDKAKSGEYAVRMSGTATERNGSYYYKIADTKIKVKNGMKLTYSMMPENTLGRNAVISLIFDDGSRLRNADIKDKNGVVMSAKNARGTVGTYSEISCSFGNAFPGKVITGIEIGYEGNSTGNFAVYFDHILIEDGEDTPTVVEGSFDGTGVDGYIDFSGTNNREEGIHLVTFTEEGQEGYTYKKKENGSNCLMIPATKYAYFQADTGCVNGNDKELKIGVTYLDNTRGTILLEYNAIEGTQNTQNSNYARLSVQGTNTGEWKTVVFEIPNANFRKGQNNGADFRVSNYEMGVAIKDIYVINESTKVVEGSFDGTGVDGYIDFSGTNNREEGIHLVTFTEEGQEGYTYKKKENGSNCLMIPATKYAYFQADTGCVNGNDKELKIGVTYLDNTRGTILLEYNAIEGTQNTQNSNYARLSVQGTNTGEWKTVIFEIPNANFRKGQNNGADFRVSNYEMGVAVKDIYVINESRADLDGYIDFSGMDNKEEGIHLVTFTEEGQEGYTYKKKENGSNCLMIPATKYAYFQADTGCVNRNDKALKIGVTYLDNIRGTILLEYNAIEGTQNTQNSNYARLSVQGTNTGEWKTVVFEISNANFRKGQNNGADFRVSNYEMGVAVKDIFIMK